VRAALEGVCQQLALVLASMRDAGHEVREVRATGGFARSAFWRQLLTDALGMPVGFPTVDQGSAYGAALLGQQGVGLLPPGPDALADAAADVALDEVLTPTAAAELYTARLPLLERVHDALADVADELAR
jgi:gluconokinase